MPTDPLVAGAIKEQTAMQLAQFTKELATMGELAVIAGILDASIGATSYATPGSVRTSLDNLVTKMADIDATLDKIVTNQSALESQLKEMAFALQAQTNAATQQTYLQSVALMDQLENNAITQAETRAALERNGIEPQPAVDVKTLVKKSVSNAGIMKTTTEFSSAVSNTVNGIIDSTLNWIKTSGPVVYAQDAIKQTFENVAIFKTVKAAFNPTSVNNAAIKAKNNLAISAKLPAAGPAATPDPTAY
jgi:hypothetical protein